MHDQCSGAGWLAVGAVSRTHGCRDEPGQALRDDLARLGDQLTNDLSGRFDLVDQANALTRQAPRSEAP